MSAEERRALAQIYDYPARSLFFQDKFAFGDCVTRLYNIEPAVPIKLAQDSVAGSGSWPSMGCGAPFMGSLPI